MNAPPSGIDLFDIASAVRAVDPSARLLPPRLVRRLVRRALGLTSNQNLPHCFCVDAATSDVEAFIDRSRLGDEPLPERVLLLPLPEDGEDIEAYKVELWKWLFHAQIDRAVERSGLAFSDRPELFTATQVAEIRLVLEAEHRLPTGDQKTLFREFAAAFLESTHFHPGRLRTWFPGILCPDDVADWIAEHIDAGEILNRTRFDPLLVWRGGPSDAQPADDTLDGGLEVTRSNPDHQWAESAQRAAEKGNDVRAAIIFRQLADGRTAAEAALRRLAARLVNALHRPAAEVENWYRRLEPVLNHAAAHGFWDVGDRLLYELQKACLDVERKVYTVDVIEWAITLGEQPIKRLLDKPKEVNVLRRLRAAERFARRLPPDAQPGKVVHLLEGAIRHVEHRVRTANRPVIHGVLDKVGLKPTNPPEEVARKKLVEELLDVVCSRGFLKMGDVRDAIARNRLKLPDMRSPVEFVVGDPLIRANRLLAVRMDGIYRRGEVYMRALQRASSLAFGTPIGRLLVLFLLLPFGGAFVILEGVQHLLHFAEGILSFFGRLITGAPAPPPADHHHGGGLANPYTIAALGLFLIGIIQSTAFRRATGRYARRLLFDVPTAVARSSWVRGLFNNVVTRFFARRLLTPLLVGAVVGIGLRLAGIGLDETSLGAGAAALLTAVAFRTRWGRGLEERLDESLAQVWKIVSVNFLVGLLTLILSFFRLAFELIERGIYAVDERLRFREGENTLTLAFKVVFGFFWFFVTYVFRFAWNLLIEPQINPIKHFPVVTVSHKLILPTVIPPAGPIPSPFAKVLMSVFSDLTPQVANGIATGVVTGIPGIFGFLVWELKENWKLYRANGARTLRPISVGSHGERVRGLLRPGFHSGVVPKTFAKLRDAESDGNRTRAAKLHHNLDHVAEAVDRLFDRELVGLLRIAKRWDGTPLPTVRVHLSTNRLRVLLDREGSPESVIVSIEERGGWLIGSVEQEGWLKSLPSKPRSAFADALAAVYKLAGVHLTREHVAALLEVKPYQIDCRAEGLIIHSVEGSAPVLMNADDVLTVVADRPLDGRALPTFKSEDLRLDERSVAWDEWVERWEQDRAGKGATEPLLGGYRVLPSC